MTRTTAADAVRYCDYPGERLIKGCTFSVNGTPHQWSGWCACPRCQNAFNGGHNGCPAWVVADGPWYAAVPPSAKICEACADPAHAAPGPAPDAPDAPGAPSGPRRSARRGKKASRRD